MKHRSGISARTLVILICCMASLVSANLAFAQQKGTFQLGEKVPVASATISPDGGTIKVAGTKTPLDGLVLEIPKGAFKAPQAVTIAFQEIKGQTFSAMVNPVSPLVVIDCGQEYAAEIMKLVIPCNVEEGGFAMGFYYLADQQSLEGLPLVDLKAKEVSIATRHFRSPVFVSAMPAGLLGK